MIWVLVVAVHIEINGKIAEIIYCGPLGKSTLADIIKKISGLFGCYNVQVSYCIRCVTVLGMCVDHYSIRLGIIEVPAEQYVSVRSRCSERSCPCLYRV